MTAQPWPGLGPAINRLNSTGLTEPCSCMNTARNTSPNSELLSRLSVAVASRESPGSTGTSGTKVTDVELDTQGVGTVRRQRRDTVSYLKIRSLNNDIFYNWKIL